MVHYTSSARKGDDIDSFWRQLVSLWKWAPGLNRILHFIILFFDNLHNLPWLSNLVLLPAFCNLKLTPCHAFVYVNRGSERKVYLHVLHLSLVLLVSMPRIGQDYSFRFCYGLILTVIKETVNDRKKMGWDWEMTRVKNSVATAQYVGAHALLTRPWLWQDPLSDPHYGQAEKQKRKGRMEDRLFPNPLSIPIIMVLDSLCQDTSFIGIVIQELKISRHLFTFHVFPNSLSSDEQKGVFHSRMFMLLSLSYISFKICMWLFCGRYFEMSQLFCVHTMFFIYCVKCALCLFLKL